MGSASFFIVFILGTLIFIGGVPPTSYFGIYAVTGLFGLWGLYTSFPRHLWGAVLAGVILDSFSVFPFGTHILVFFLLGIAMWVGKKFLVSRYLWGDLAMVIITTILGEVTIPIGAWVLGQNAVLSWFSPEYLLSRTIALILSALVFFLILRWQYQRGSIEARGYAN
ncbi:MAG: hypothetical protein HYT39_02205 [Candidatus Sungbacteria bacterium]|nr:hypothetical protein [Candidatus Sungbacteria bacterium]